MSKTVDFNEEFNEQIKIHLFNYPTLFSSPADYLRQIFITCGGGYDFNPSTGELMDYDHRDDFKDHMVYPEVYESLVETKLRYSRAQFVEENIDEIIEQYDGIPDLDGRSPLEMHVGDWSSGSNTFSDIYKFLFENEDNVKVMTFKTMAATAMFCKWIVRRSTSSSMVYKPDGSEFFKPHGSYNVPDTFPAFVTVADKVYKILENEYIRRTGHDYNEESLKLILEMLESVGKEEK